MNNLNERIERVLKLDAERTRGEWETVGMGCWTGAEIIGAVNGPQIATTNPNVPNNGAFIASAPEMVSIIREQRELLRKLSWTVDRGLHAHKVGASTLPSLLTIRELLEQAGITSEKEQPND